MSVVRGENETMFSAQANATTAGYFNYAMMIHSKKSQTQSSVYYDRSTVGVVNVFFCS
jgi:hypothetical protein